MTLNVNGTAARSVAMGLERNGFAIAFTDSTTASICSKASLEIDRLDTAGELLPGTVAECGANVARRADRIVWLTNVCDMSATVHLRALWNAIDAFLFQCAPWISASKVHDPRQNHVPIILGESTDAMVAVYGADGCAYAPHVDNPDGDGRECQDDGRLLTAVVYLNASPWNMQHGGQLRLRSSTGQYLDVTPALGTIVFFRADALVHEVRPAFATRRAMTVWYMGRRKANVDGAFLRSE